MISHLYNIFGPMHWRLCLVSWCLHEFKMEMGDFIQVSLSIISTNLFTRPWVLNQLESSCGLTVFVWTCYGSYVEWIEFMVMMPHHFFMDVLNLLQQMSTYSYGSFVTLVFHYVVLLFICLVPKLVLNLYLGNELQFKPLSLPHTFDYHIISTSP